MKKAKKAMIYLAASVLYVFGFVIGIFFTMALQDVQTGVLEFGGFLYIASGALVCLFLIMLGLNQLNEAADRIHGRPTVKGEVTRWAEQLLFADCLLVFVTILVRKASEADRVFLAPFRTQCLYTGLTAMVLTGVLQYVRLCMRRRKRSVRIGEIASEGSLHGERRFAMTAVKVLNDRTVAGHVCGEVRRGDPVFIYLPAGKKLTGKVVRLEADGNRMRKVKDCNAVMSVKTKGKLPLYCVISDVEQFCTADGINNTEGPQLVGYIDAYAECYQKDAFVRAMIRTAVSLKYLVPAKMAPDTERMYDLPDTLLENTSVQFPSVITKNLPDEPALPVFTDWTALANYREVNAEKDAASLVMDLPQCLKIVYEGYAGVVVNPFGPKAFFFSKEYLEQILQKEGKNHAESEVI